jgi:hypothetical protein
MMRFPLGSGFGRVIKGFATWYWRLPVVGMVMATVGIVISANYLLASLGISPADRYEITMAIGIVLLGAAAGACFWRALFGDERRKGRT